MSEEIVVGLAMPKHHTAVAMGAARGYLWALPPNAPGIRIVYLEGPPGTLLNQNFNRHWAQALNARDHNGLTHFAMIHSDVCPEGVWLADLLDILVEKNADLVAAHVAIKDDRRLTSTAISYGDIWRRRRITIAEAAALPETIGSEDVGGHLLANTGLWVCDLRRDWCDKVLFDSWERITWRDGKRVAEVVPEDWLFSHSIHEATGGGKIYATRRIPVLHDGDSRMFPSYPNGHGGWDVDRDYFKCVGQEPFPIQPLTEAAA